MRGKDNVPEGLGVPDVIETQAKATTQPDIVRQWVNMLSQLDKDMLEVCIQDFHFCFDFF